MRAIEIEAAVCIVASDQVWRNPGDRWACPADEAEGLIASAAAVRVDGPDSRPTGNGAVPPAEPVKQADRQGPAVQPAMAGVLTAVSGIGPSTEAALHAAGVNTLADLATLTDEEIAGLELDENIRRRIRDDWRSQAAELLDAGGAPS